MKNKNKDNDGFFKLDLSFDELDLPKGFIQGLEAGGITRTLQSDKPERFAPVAARRSNAEYFEKVAPQLGYSVKIEQSPDPYWIWPVFTRNS